MGDEELAGQALPGRWPQIVLAVIVLIFFLAAQALSDRPQLPLNRPWIDHVADLPATADRDRYTELVYATTAQFPTGRRLTITRLGEKPRQSDPGNWYRDNPAKLGYSIKEFVALSMPFFATKEFGYVLYVDNDSYMAFSAPLDDEMLKKLRDEVKAPVGEGYTFRWWNHLWGWIPLLALIGIVVLEVRRAGMKRRQSGIL